MPVLGSWYLVLGGRVRPSACWDWDWVWDWVTQASPKGHPSVAQGPSLGENRVSALFAIKATKRGWGRVRKADIAPHRETRKTRNLPLINTDDTDRNKTSLGMSLGWDGVSALES